MHSKEILAEFIYKLNRLFPFELQQPWYAWSAPVIGFAYDDSLPYKFLKDMKKKNLLGTDTKNIICILGDWESIAEGIIFTDQYIYSNSSKNKDKGFKVYYKDIVDLEYNSYEPALLIRTNSSWHTISTPVWSKRNIHDFLQFACGQYNFDSARKDEILNIILVAESMVSVQELAEYSRLRGICTL